MNLLKGLLHHFYVYISISLFYHLKTRCYISDTIVYLLLSLRIYNDIIKKPQEQRLITKDHIRSNAYTLCLN